MNSDRGLLVVGTVKQAPAAGGTARKILKKDVVESRHDQLLSRLFYERCARLLLKNASSDSSKIRYQTKDWAGLQGGKAKAKATAKGKAKRAAATTEEDQKEQEPSHADEASDGNPAETDKPNGNPAETDKHAETDKPDSNPAETDKPDSNLEPKEPVCKRPSNRTREAKQSSEEGPANKKQKTTKEAHFYMWFSILQTVN
eukprot:s1705_g12.t1